MELLARALFSLTVPSLVKQGLSSNAILNFASGMGFGVRRQWGLDQIRRVTGLWKMEGVLETADRDSRVSPFNYVESDLRRDYAYRIYGEQTLYDSYTGKFITRPGSMYTDRARTLNEWQQDFVNEENDYESDPNYVTVGFLVKSIEHNRGYPY